MGNSVPAAAARLRRSAALMQLVEQYFAFLRFSRPVGLTSGMGAAAFMAGVIVIGITAPPCRTLLTLLAAKPLTRPWVDQDLLAAFAPQVAGG
jgi:hypothetical protein